MEAKAQWIQTVVFEDEDDENDELMLEQGELLRLDVTKGLKETKFNQNFFWK